MTGGLGPVRSGPAVAIASLYKPDLVTRHTGRAVRLSIESLLAEYEGHLLTVLDFRDVTVIDFSCADEVVAKLVLASLPEARPPRDRFFLFRGIGDHHLDPVQSALDRRRLTVAAERDNGERTLIGHVERHAARVWEAVCSAGRAPVRAVAAEIRLPEPAARAVLEDLYGRRLLIRVADEYVSLFQALAEAGAAGPRP
ncbi:MAG: hypothetical protein ACE5JR_08675 [Gemmatimonadota bacterium]